MSDNPFAPPSSEPGRNLPSSGSLNLDSATIKKMEAICKDGEQYLLAILLCFFCSGLGMVIIGPWYLTRLMSWNGIASRHPELLNPDVPPTSLARRFQKAKTKLIVGLVFGAVMVCLLVLLLLLAGTRAAAKG